MGLPLVAALLGVVLVERHTEAMPLGLRRLLGRRVEVVLDDAGCMDVGTPVRTGGRTIGRVTRLEYLPASGRVLVEMHLFVRTFRVHPRYEFLVRAGSVVDVDPGDLEATPLPWARFGGTREPDPLHAW